MKSDRRRVAGNDTRTSDQDAQKSANEFLNPAVIFVLFAARQVAGEQMRHGLKPCDTASAAVEKPTRFLVEM